MVNIVSKNIINNILGTLISILAPLIIIPVLTKELGITDYGVYVTLIAKSTLFLVLFEFGFGMYFGRIVSQNRDDNDELSNIYSLFVFLKVVISSLASILVYLLSDNSNSAELLICIYTWLQIMNPSAFVSGLEKYKLLAKVQLFSKSVMIFLVLFLSFRINGIQLVLMIHIFSILIVNSILYFNLKNEIRFSVIALNTASLIEVLKGGMSFYGARLFVNLYQQASTYLVSFFLSSDLVAIYSISIQLYRVGQAIIGAISKVLYTSTVKTKDFILLKMITIKSLIAYGLLIPVVYFLGELILSLIFDFDTSLLYHLSSMLYISLFSSIISSYWGYPALTAIGKENYAHIGILASSIMYFLVFGVLFMFNALTITTLILCVIVSDFSGMLLRLRYARRFQLL